MSAKVRRFAVTIKITKSDRIYLAADYQQPIEILLEKQRRHDKEFTIDSSVYELDSKGKVHYHGIWTLIRGEAPYFKEFNCKGCSCLIREIYHPTGWHRYIHKNQQDSHMDKSPPDIGDLKV